MRGKKEEMAKGGSQKKKALQRGEETLAAPKQGKGEKIAFTGEGIRGEGGREGGQRGQDGGIPVQIITPGLSPSSPLTAQSSLPGSMGG